MAEPRIYVRPDAASAIDAALPRVIGELGAMVKRTDLASVALLVGLRHRDEVVAELRQKT